MGTRRNGREAAIKILYTTDITAETEFEKLIGEYFTENPSKSDTMQFCTTLAMGVLNNKVMIDATLEETLKNWDLDRLGYMERAILRLGYYEISQSLDTPNAVIIDEAIELAKIYCGPDSAKLVNATLDRLSNQGNGTKQRPTI
ncbi:MAG TPA: transcription antitermination factor NusB [Nitrospinota bacterium]|jgi:N utilization substance protein B|nr:transcription antitermination factor NusB [Nitrospinota bacterium]|tara:strand:- start:104739 stop:105170 length:432 start_codon:yes stop_codon:yes gene_type:complete